MPKGAKTAPVGFATYRERQSPTVQAMRMDSGGDFLGQVIKPGDFLVKDAATGALSIVDGDEFINKYEQKRATWTRKKKKVAEGEASTPQEVEAEQGAVAAN